MKTFVVFFLITTALIYLLFSFLYATFNPMELTQEIRGWMIFAFIFGNAFTACLAGMYNIENPWKSKQ